MPKPNLATRPGATHGLRTIADVARLVELAGVDTKTALRWLAGLQVYRTSADRLEPALREFHAERGADG